MNLTANASQTIYPTKSNVNFTGSTPKIPESKIFQPIKKFFKPVTRFVKRKLDRLTTYISMGQAKILDTKIAKRIVLATVENKIDIVKHISSGIGLIISGLYIKKTLANDKLAPQQKTTLAINQGAVSVTATILGYTFEGLADKKINSFIKKFNAVNVENKELKLYQGGIKAAASMMIFAMMYRFVAPVVVTPIANHIGNKIQAKKEAELALNKKA